MLWGFYKNFVLNNFLTLRLIASSLALVPSSRFVFAWLGGRCARVPVCRLCGCGVCVCVLCCVWLLVVCVLCWRSFGMNAMFLHRCRLLLLSLRNKLFQLCLKKKKGFLFGWQCFELICCVNVFFFLCV